MLGVGMQAVGRDSEFLHYGIDTEEWRRNEAGSDQARA
jgi:hypothetical protein